jgi:hypothetical protein
MLLQFHKTPGLTLLAVIAATLVWLMKHPGERLAAWARGDREDAPDRFDYDQDAESGSWLD